MASAIPVRDMILEDMSKALSSMKLAAIVIGIWMIILSALRQ